MPLSVKEIISGVDITSHYLGSESQPFKIFRHNKNVYAVRYNETEAVDFVHLWGSHKGEMQSKNEYLGSGVFGQVFKKTENKAFKEIGDKKYKGHEIKANLAILEQKFLLQEHGIDQYFVLGLWNIKDKSNVVFNMPKLEMKYPSKMDFQPQYEAFVLGLKKLNERGYCHPDLANDPWHNSPQNLFFTADGLRAVDLDSGFYPHQNNEKMKIYGKDQWLYVYNHRFPPENTKRNQWRQEIEDWYNKHQGQALSDNPVALFNLHNRGKIALPADMVYEMHLKNSDKAVEEYRSGSQENRVHRFHEVSADDFPHERFKREYKSIKGDALKRTILHELKDELAQVGTREELMEIKTRFLNSPEMAIFDKAQGKWTHRFDLKTDSHKAVEKLFAAAEERLNDADKAKGMERPGVGKS